MIRLAPTQRVKESIFRWRWRRLLIAHGFHRFPGGFFFFVFFWPGAAKKAHKQNEKTNKQKTEERPCKSDFQDFGKAPTSSETNKKNIVLYGETFALS